MVDRLNGLGVSIVQNGERVYEEEVECNRHMDSHPSPKCSNVTVAVNSTSSKDLQEYVKRDENIDVTVYSDLDHQDKCKNEEDKIKETYFSKDGDHRSITDVARDKECNIAAKVVSDTPVSDCLCTFTNRSNSDISLNNSKMSVDGTKSFEKDRAAIDDDELANEMIIGENDDNLIIDVGGAEDEKFHLDIDEQRRSSSTASSVTSTPGDDHIYCIKRKYTELQERNEQSSNLLGLRYSQEEQQDQDYDTCSNDRFFFESDHLALKNNEDYQLLLRTLAVLEAQRAQACQDVCKLIKIKKDALYDPIKFVERLQAGDDAGIPRKQSVLQIPLLKWEEYTKALSVLSQAERDKLIKRQSARYFLLAEASGKGDASLKLSDDLPTSAGGDMEFLHSESRIQLSSANATLPRYMYPITGAIVRGRVYDDTKPVSFNQLWTPEEQLRLEKLLEVYPSEEVESRRWEKIAKALGNRTAKQVASRVQKYFIRLAKLGLPIPGRVPNMPFYKKGTKKLTNNPISYQPISRPSVYMSENDRDACSIDSEQSMSISEVVSEDEGIETSLKTSDEYKELIKLKRIKKMQARFGNIQHHGYQCDRCGMEPILGPRFHCKDCPVDDSVDFCKDCAISPVEIRLHKLQHELQVINQPFYIDDDYIGFTGTIRQAESTNPSSTGYSYLDPNYFPNA